MRRLRMMRRKIWMSVERLEQRRYIAVSWN